MGVSVSVAVFLLVTMFAVFGRLFARTSRVFWLLVCWLILVSFVSMRVALEVFFVRVVFLVRKSVRRCARVSLCLRLCASGCAIKQTMQKCSQSLWTISILGMVVALSTPGKEILLDGAVQSAWRDYSSRPCLKVDKTGPHENLFFLFPLNEKS